MDHFHDEPPDFFITNNRLSRPKPKASLAALQWAAERANLSYGVFTLNLTEADQSVSRLSMRPISRRERTS